VITFVFGDEPFLIEDFLRKEKAKQEDWCHLEGDFELSQLAVALQNLSLFSSQPIFMINPWFLNKSIEDKALLSLQSLLQDAHLNSSITLLIGCPQKIDQRKKLVSWLKKNSVTQEFKGFKDWEQDKVLVWLKNRALDLGKSLTHPAAILLEQLGGTDLRYLASELDTLVTYIGTKETVEPTDILAISTGASGRLFQFTEALKNRNMENALLNLDRLFDNNEDPVKLLGFIAATLRLYLHISVGLSQKLSVTDLAQKIGKNPYFIKQLLPSVQQHYTHAHLIRLFDYLRTTDLGIKTGKTTPQIAVTLLTVEICKR